VPILFVPDRNLKEVKRRRGEERRRAEKQREGNAKVAP
jgi:hypothetical protein